MVMMDDELLFRIQEHQRGKDSTPVPIALLADEGG